MPSDPTPNVVDILAQATNAHQEGDLSRASKLYLEVLELEPNNVDALHRVGLLFLGRGQFDEAHQFLTQAVAGNPENASFLNHLGVALLNRGETEDAIDHFQKSIALDEKYVEARLNLAIVQRATDQLFAAWDTITLASQTDPTNPAILVWRGRIERECGFVQEALESLTAASELEPENTEALGLMGDVMVDLNDLAMAERCYRHALEIDDQLTDLRARLANCLSSGGRDDEARVEYERAVEIDGENGALWGAMALLLSR